MVRTGCRRYNKENRQNAHNFLINIIYNELKIDNIVNMQRIRKNYIKEDIIKILEIRGTCVNQISRVTGINRKIIQEVKNGRK